MSIYATSDLHGQLPPIPGDCDLLLIAGDICPDYFTQRYIGSDIRLDKGAQHQAKWFNNEFRDWCKDVRTVATWGNHDFLGEHWFLVDHDHPCTLLRDRETVQGLRIYGTPWVPNLPFWAFYGDERKLEVRAAAIPWGLDVLMTHGPPANCGDRIPAGSKYGNLHKDIFVGDATLNDAIERARPFRTICGHIHEGRGYHYIEDNVVINVSAVDEDYVLREHPFTKLY